MEAYHLNKLEGIVRNLTHESTLFGQESHFYLNATKIIVSGRIHSSLVEGNWVEVYGDWQLWGEVFNASTIKVITPPLIYPFANQLPFFSQNQHEETILIGTEKKWTFFHFFAVVIVIYIILNFLSTS